MSEDVLLSERDGAVAILTMNRPRAKNALTSDLIKALEAEIQKAAEDRSVRAIVLTGAGGSFCAGADLKSAMSGGGGFESFDMALEAYHRIIRSIVGAPKPVVAMVEGCAVGFGCDIALACDLRMMAKDAYLQEKFVKIGLMPDGGGTFWLPRLVGSAKAMELILLGEPVNGDEAVSLGIANRSVPASELRAETMALAQKLAKGPPIAYAEIKRAVRLSWGGTIDAALDQERAGQIRCLKSGDCMEGVMAWMQKREPEFKGE